MLGIGVMKILNIVQQNGQLNSFEFFQSKYLNFTVTDYFLILGLHLSMPSKWKSILQSGPSKTSPIQISMDSELSYKDEQTLNKVTAKKIYNVSIIRI